MAISQFVDKKINPLSGDPLALPRFNLVDMEGNVISQNVALILQNQVAVAGSAVAAGTLNPIVDIVNQAAIMSSGAWTPTLGGADSNPVGVVYNAQIGVWMRIGNLVYISFQLDIANIGNSGAGLFVVGGLPYRNTGLRAHGSTSIGRNKPAPYIGMWGSYVQAYEQHILFTYKDGTNGFDADWVNIAQNGMTIEASYVYTTTE